MPAAMAGLNVGPGAVSNHPGVGLRKSMTHDHFLKSVEALFSHNLDRLEEARQARSLNFPVLFGGASLGEQDGLMSLAQELRLSRTPSRS